MKKTMKMTLPALVLLLALLLSACGQGNPAEPPEDTTTTNGAEATTLSEAESDYLDRYEQLPPTSGDPMAFCNLFPDPFFAKFVAEAFGKEVTDITTHEALAAYDGGLECLPGGMESMEGIGLLTGLTSLVCSKNNLETLPAEIGKLTNLTELNLYKAFALQSLPPEVGQLKKLTTLRVEETALETLPKEIGGCEALEVLNASAAPIASIPDEIGQLKKLRILDLSTTNLASVPDGLCELSSLKELYLGHTELTALPKDIGNLRNLERLNLFGCKLKTLPESMKQLENLRQLNVNDNFELDESYKTWFDKEVYA